MKYDFIGTHANDFPVKLLCRQLGVQRSAYYDWRAQPGKLIAPEELALRRRMKELFAASRGSLGSRMMMKNLRQEGFEIGRDKTRRLMKSLQLTGEAQKFSPPLRLILRSCDCFSWSIDQHDRDKTQVVVATLLSLSNCK